MTTIKWGVLGASGIAQEKTLNAIATASNAELLRVGSRDRAKADRIAKEFGATGAGATYDEVLADPAVQAVYVSLPNSVHAEWILKALDAGKAVLSEKPLTVTEEEARQVAARSKETGLPVMEGLMYRFHPQNAYVRELIARGDIGEVREVQVFNAFRLLDGIDATNIRLTDGLGGGSIMDMGCYVVSAARMLFGTEPVGVTGWLDIAKEYGIDAGFAGILEFPGTRFAPISWSFRTGFGAGYRVLGSKASVEVPRAFIPGQAGQITNTVVITVDRTGTRTAREFEPASSFRLEFEEFSQALIENRPPLYDVDDAVKNARVLDMVRAMPRREA